MLLEGLQRFTLYGVPPAADLPAVPLHAAACTSSSSGAPLTTATIDWCAVADLREDL
jgi:hypothetical protein